MIQAIIIILVIIAVIGFVIYKYLPVARMKMKESQLESMKAEYIQKVKLLKIQREIDTLNQQLKGGI